MSSRCSRGRSPFTFAFAFLPLIVAVSACTTKTTTTTSAPAGSSPEEGTGEETSTDPSEETPKEEEKEQPKEPEKVEIARAVLSGTFSKVDVTYGRAGKFIVLDMKGDAAGLSSSVTTLKASQIDVSTTTSYELLYPALGACDKPPELTIAGGKVHVAMQRAGEPNGTISGCYYLSSGVKASDGGFQARLKNVPIAGGGTVKELLLDIAGPKT